MILTELNLQLYVYPKFTSPNGVPKTAGQNDAKQVYHNYHTKFSRRKP
jgi:hypothetical protein